MRRPLSSHLGLIAACLIFFEETIQWVHVSAPAGCSPRGLGGMSYPFKGFESSEWAHLGKTKGHVGQLLL
jgi:hypothetical protein